MDKFQLSKNNGIHSQLARLEGNWAGITRTWFEPEVLADESPMKGTFKAVLDGRFMLYQYEGMITGKPFEGIALIGYSINNDAFQCAWVDSFHMGTDIMLSEGRNPEKLFSVVGSYGGPGIPEPWGWRTEIELQDADTLVITAYNITPQGEESKATETIYKRS